MSMPKKADINLVFIPPNKWHINDLQATVNLWRQLGVFLGWCYALLHISRTDRHYRGPFAAERSLSIACAGKSGALFLWRIDASRWHGVELSKTSFHALARTLIKAT